MAACISPEAKRELLLLESYIRKNIFPSKNSIRFDYPGMDKDALESGLQSVNLPYVRFPGFTFLITLTRDRWIEICEYGIFGKPADCAPSIPTVPIGSPVHTFDCPEYIQGGGGGGRCIVHLFY